MENKCKGLEKDVCEETENCMYVKGFLKNYCRSTSYVPNFLLTNKNHKKNTPIQTSKNIKRSPNSSSNKTLKNIKITANSNITSNNIKITENAEKKIHNFFKKNSITNFKKNIHINYLKTVCSDSNVCIAFGIESEKIIKFFDNFSNFNLLSMPLKSIEENSQNGFVKELTYEKDGYTANTILKSSVKTTADNLLYEGLVGFVLNKIGKQFPCFIETYGIYKYLCFKLLNKMSNKKITITKEDISDNLKEFINANTRVSNDDIIYACHDTSITLAVMIQYLKDAKTMDHEYNIETFRQNHLIETLFQIYMPLAHLIDKFTHYDLHPGNVLIYEPVNNGFIEYVYHLKNNEIVTFKSPYIAKIIDYGRCFFWKNINYSSQIIANAVKKICSIEKDNEGFYKRNGFYQLFNESSAESNYISSSLYNQSHDLTLLYMLKKKKKLLVNNDILQMYNKLKYETEYGTPSNDSGYPKSLNNCHDAYLFLKDAINKKNKNNKNNKNNPYNGLINIGTLHIYTDGKPMEFIKSMEFIEYMKSIKEMRV